MQPEDVLITRLQERDIKAFKQLMRLTIETLTDYCIVKLKNPKRGRHIVDELFVKWLGEGFCYAVSPLSKWMMQEVDKACERELQPS